MIRLQSSFMSPNFKFFTYSCSSSWLTIPFFNCWYSYSQHLDLSWTLAVLSNTVHWSFASERKRDRASKKRIKYNQNQPTTEGNNVRNGRNQYSISTHPASRMLGRKDDWEPAGVLTWKSKQIIEGKRSQRLILSSEGPCSRHRVGCT